MARAAFDSNATASLSGFLVRRRATGTVPDSSAAGFEADEIYFTAGPNDEENGLFGSLAFTGDRK